MKRKKFENSKEDDASFKRSDVLPNWGDSFFDYNDFSWKKTPFSQYNFHGYNEIRKCF